jgi:membrane associated rhomboid family serine protease
MPQTAHGLLGILTLPFLHGDWEHLLANIPAVLVLGTALYYCYPTLAHPVMIISWLASGFLTWCIGNPGSIHVGASALIYSLNLFLILSGFIRGNRQLIVISLIMVFLYGGFVWGMIPALAKLQNISWEGHLSGAIIGIVLALILRKKGPQKEEHHWEEDDDNDDSDEGDNPGEKPYWDVPMPSDEDLKIEYRFRH